VKCPNCQFELKNPGPNCPFCQYQLPQQQKPASPAPGSAVPAPGGAAPEPDAQPQSTQENEAAPENFEIPDPMAVPENAATAQDAPAPSAEAPPIKPPSGGTTGIKLMAIIGVAFLGYKLGMFDNILMLFGMAGEETSPPPIAAIPIPEPAPPSAEAPPPAVKTGDAPLPPHKEQTFDPLEDPRMKALNAEVDRKIAASAAPKKRRKPFVEGESVEPEAGESEVEPALSEEDWLFQGRIYDMISLKPVAGAELMLMDKTEQEIYTAQSDAKGGFEFDVPSVEGGYRLVVDHPYYLADYFDEKSPPYHKTPLSQRRQLRAARPSHRPWTGGARSVRRDIVLYPEIPDR
jgi:hypothetical protein